MKYRKLGKTQLEISEVSLGTWQLGGEWGKSFTEKQAEELLHAAVDEGVNLLDTADKYGDGYSEKIVGKVIRERPEKIYIATKCGRKLDPHVPEGYNKENLRRFVDESLQNTKLETLDLLQLHCPPPGIYKRNEVFETLDQLKQEGKIQHYGMSVETMEEAKMALEWPGVETLQVIFNMFRQRPIEELFPLVREKDIGILARVPLASGLLSGKMTGKENFDQKDHRNFNRKGDFFDVGETFAGVDMDKGLRAVDELKSYFNTGQLYKYALKWILMYDEVSCVIPGASNVDQARSNASVSEMDALTPQQMDKVKEIYDEYIRELVHEKW